MSEENGRSVVIDESTFERVEVRLGHTEFESVSEYVEYVMEELLLYVDQEFESDEAEDIDEDEVKDRLQSLGYLRD